MIVFELLLLALELFFYGMLLGIGSYKGNVGLKICLCLFYGIPAAVLLFMFYEDICMGELEPFLWWIDILLIVPVAIGLVGRRRK